MVDRRSDFPKLERRHSDFGRRLISHAADTTWQPSLLAGVGRRMGDRTGRETDRAPGIVCFAAGAASARRPSTTAKKPCYRSDLGMTHYHLTGRKQDAGQKH